MPHRPRNPSGFVRKHPDTASLRWQGVVKYWDVTEERWRPRSKTFGRKAEAQAWVEAALAEHRSTPRTDRRPTRPWRNSWLVGLPNWILASPRRRGSAMPRTWPPKPQVGGAPVAGTHRPRYSRDVRRTPRRRPWASDGPPRAHHVSPCAPTRRHGRDLAQQPHGRRARATGSERAACDPHARRGPALVGGGACGAVLRAVVLYLACGMSQGRSAGPPLDGY